MKDQGPSLEGLLQHLRDAPAAVRQAMVDTYALISDVLSDLEAAPVYTKVAQSLAAIAAKSHGNGLHFQVVLAWLLSHESLRRVAVRDDASRKTAARLLLDGFPELAANGKAEALVEDDERAEELVRLVLREFGLRPQGESAGAAEARLAALDSVARAQLLEQSRKTLERARELKVLEAMKRAEQEAAAAKVSRE